ncbi:hypothetical protein [Salinicoccus albus]|uniref:hypothetical protein n=1 Tax=Salinicoccus albus TaxID=418756 RepID=UPI00037F9A34|nr:hypothetical protein [Salinicoccus albus]
MIDYKVTQSGDISEDFAKNQLGEVNPMSYEEKAVLTERSYLGIVTFVYFWQPVVLSF